MAGIGLALRKLTADQTYLGGAAAYFSSGVIAAGPWLISALTLSLTQGQVSRLMSASDHRLLFATISCAFIASLVITGPVQMVLTRQISDSLFVENLNEIAPVFNRTLSLSALGLSCVSLLFMWAAPFDIVFRLFAATLFVTLSLIWLALVAVSGLKDYLSLLAAFLIGFAVSGAAMIALAYGYGAAGSLAGFALGQTLTLSLLIQRIQRGFPTDGAEEVSLISAWSAYWKLSLIGLLYYGGLWADKAAWWFSPSGITIAGFYRAFPPYDSAIMAAYLLTIPAMAIFVVTLETRFYLAYQEFFSHVLTANKSNPGKAPGGTLDDIFAARDSMRSAARDGFWALAKAQGAIAGVACLLATDLARLIGLSTEFVPTMRAAILAASGQVFVLYFMLLLLYLDAQSEALALVAAFALLNTALSGIVLGDAYGLGYFAATVVASIIGGSLLVRRLDRLGYITFMLQPFRVDRYDDE